MAEQTTVDANSITYANSGVDRGAVQMGSSTVTVQSDSAVSAVVDSTSTAKGLKVVGGTSSVAVAGDADKLTVDVINTTADSDSAEVRLYSGDEARVAGADSSGTVLSLAMNSSGDLTLSNEGDATYSASGDLRLNQQGGSANLLINGSNGLTIKNQSGLTYTWPTSGSGSTSFDRVLASSAPSSNACSLAFVPFTRSWIHTWTNVGSGDSFWFQGVYDVAGANGWPKYFPVATARKFCHVSISIDNEYKNNWSSGRTGLLFYRTTFSDTGGNQLIHTLVDKNSGGAGILESSFEQVYGGLDPEGSSGATWVYTQEIDLDYAKNELFSMEGVGPNTSGGEITVILSYY